MYMLWIKLKLLKIGQNPDKPIPSSLILLLPKRIREKILNKPDPNIYK